MLILYDFILPYSWRTFWLAKYHSFPLRKPTQLLGKNMGKTPLLERSWWKAPALAFSTPSGPLTAAARWLAMQWGSQVRLVGLGNGIWRWPKIGRDTDDEQAITISWWWEKGWYRQKKILVPSAETELFGILDMDILCILLPQYFHEPWWILRIVKCHWPAFFFLPKAEAMALATWAAEVAMFFLWS